MSVMENHKKQKKAKQKPAKPVLEPLSNNLGLGDTKFSRALGSTDFLTREQGLAALSRWLATRTDVSDMEMLRLWKGIYFCFWHSDKVPVQTDLAERLAALLPQLKPAVATAYFSGFLATMRREWFNMDCHRLNKFLMLVRKFIHQLFVTLKRSNWSVERISALTQQLRCGAELLPPQDHRSAGLTYHIADVWLPELHSVADGEPLPADAALALLQPALSTIAGASLQAQVDRVRGSVFDELLGVLREPEEQEEAAAAWHHLPRDQLAQQMFDTASQQQVRARNREALYALHADLERLAGKKHKAAAAPQPASTPSGSTPTQQQQKQQQKAAGQQSVAAPMEVDPTAAPAAEMSAKKKKKEHKQREVLGAGPTTPQVQQPDASAAAAAAAAAETPKADGTGSAKKRKRNSSTPQLQQAGTPAADKKQQQQQQQQSAVAASPATPTAAGRPLQSLNGVAHVQQQQQQQQVVGSQSVPPKFKPGAAANGHASLAVTPIKQAAAADGAGKAASTGKKPKKVGVIINERKNQYFAHGAPPPSAELRTPPSAKPKGSALKKGSSLKPPATAPPGNRLSAKAAAGGGGGWKGRGAGGHSAGQVGGKTRQRVVFPASIPRPRAATFF